MVKMVMNILTIVWLHIPEKKTHTHSNYSDIFLKLLESQSRPQNISPSQESELLEESPRGPLGPRRDFSWDKLAC